MKKLDIKIYTDGACSGNPGPGGWGALFLVEHETKGKRKLVLKGGEKHTTNNRMELIAVLEALKFIHNDLISKYKCTIEIYSDSSYVINPVNSNWLQGWIRNGWITTKGTPIINQDLWEVMYTLLCAMNVKFIKVKGHNGNKFNEYVDQVAVKESIKYKSIQ